MTKARDLANASTALSAVDATELGYLDGVTSNIQTQFGNISGSKAQPTEPASPTDGMIWVDTDGTAIGNQVVRWSKTPANGTTTLSGNDDNSIPLSYVAGYEQVYQNGALLARGGDYTATNGTSISLTNASVTGDIFEVFASLPVAIVDTYTQAQANAAFINDSLLTTTGDIIYASGANTPARLGIGSTDQVLKVSGGVPAWSSPSTPVFVGARVYGSAVQSIPTSTYPMLTWNTESYDTDGFHDTSTNTSRFTIPAGKAGKYLFVLKTEWASSNNTGARALYFFKNGTEILEGNFSLTTRGNLQMNLTSVQTASVGDYFEMGVFQSSGVSLDIDKTLYYSEYSLTYLGA